MPATLPVWNTDLHNPGCSQFAEIEVKGAKTRGRQVSVMDVSLITTKPTRGWDEGAATTKLVFA